MEKSVHELNEDELQETISSIFVRVLEKVVGADYYSFLFLSFSSLRSWMDKNIALRAKIEENNAILDSFQASATNLKDRLRLIRKEKIKEIESLIDIRYNEDIYLKVADFKEEINGALNDLISINDSLLPSENLEREIQQIKAQIKANLSDIKFAYDSLRALKTLKIFEKNTKNQCKKEFLREFQLRDFNQKYSLAFEKLWSLALMEARALNDIANFAKQMTIKYPTGLEIFDALDIEAITSKINDYNSNYAIIEELSDEELLN